MKEFLKSCRRGAKVSWHFGILPLQIVLAIFSAVSLITAPWTLPAIANPFWKIFIQALASSIIFITLLSIGLMPYFGQKEITEEEKHFTEIKQKWFDDCKKEKEQLEQKLNQYRKRFGDLD
jgi:hypothetical protein